MNVKLGRIGEIGKINVKMGKKKLARGNVKIGSLGKIGKIPAPAPPVC